jgi:hypothetical protein
LHSLITRNSHILWQPNSDCIRFLCAHRCATSTSQPVQSNDQLQDSQCSGYLLQVTGCITKCPVWCKPTIEQKNVYLLPSAQFSIWNRHNGDKWGDLEKLETKYRKVLKCMLSLPDCTSSAAVYLNIGVLPATAKRDIEILGLLGQLALCDREAQDVRTVVEKNLTFYGIIFPGWSGLVRRTCLKYDLPDPLQYMLHPWRQDRWRTHCKKVVENH